MLLKAACIINALSSGRETLIIDQQEGVVSPLSFSHYLSLSLSHTMIPALKSPDLLKLHTTIDTLLKTTACASDTSYRTLVGTLSRAGTRTATGHRTAIGANASAASRLQDA